MRDALDAAWGDFPTDDVGYDWLRYTGPARPTAAWCAAVARHSRITFIYESTSTWSQQGYAAARSACIEHEARAREVYPGVESMAVVVSDGNGADRWDASECGRGWASVATLPFFPYGAVPICESFIQGARPSSLNLGVTWVPETWGVGTGLSQVVGFSPIPNTDLNRVRAPYYPVGPTPPTPIPTREESGDVEIFDVKGVTYHLWVGSDGHCRYRAYQNGAPQTILDISVLSGDVFFDPTVKLGRVDAFGVTVFYGAAKTAGSEIMVYPGPFGYFAKAQ